MKNVGAIGAGYTQGIQPRQSSDGSQKEIKQELQPKQNEVNASSVTPDEVMEFLAANSGVNYTKQAAPATKTIRISDYVTPEQAKRIAGFVTGFEKEVAQGLSAINTEFPEMPDDMAMVIALASFESDNY